MDFYGNQDFRFKQALSYVIHKGLLADRPVSPNCNIGQLYLTTDIGNEVLYIYCATGWKPLTVGEVSPPVSGLIFMWSGSPSAVGIGDLASYRFCDGTQYTQLTNKGIFNPDLRGYFIKSNKAGQAPDQSATQAKSHSHNMGSHTHNVSGVGSMTSYTTNQAPNRWHGQGVRLSTGANHAHALSNVSSETSTSDSKTVDMLATPLHYEIAFIIKIE